MRAAAARTQTRGLRRDGRHHAHGGARSELHRRAGAGPRTRGAPGAGDQRRGAGPRRLRHHRHAGRLHRRESAARGGLMAFSAVAPRRDAAEQAEPAGLGDPVLTQDRAGHAWGVRGAVRMAFPQPAQQVHDAAYAARLDLYMQDMLREHGLDASSDDRDWTGWSYSEMATALIQRAVPAHESVDLLVLAYAIPDINPGRNMAALLSGRCPGKPLAFGLTDQGVVAPFTALRLIREYARTAGLHRALLLIV